MRALVTVVLVVGLMLGSTIGVASKSSSVHCGRGADLQRAIDAARSGDTLIVFGICRGNFVIIGKDLELRGGAAGSTLHGRFRGATLSIDWDGAFHRPISDVRVTSLVVTGARGREPEEAAVYSWGRLTLRDSVVRGNLGDGVRGEAGTVTLRNTNVRGNGGSGVTTSMAPISLTRSTIRDNGGAGVSQSESGITALWSKFIGNGGPGITCGAQSALSLNGSLVQANGDGGIRLGYCYTTIRQSRIVANRTDLDGGGIYVGTGPAEMNFRLYRSVVRTNVAGRDGGGVFVAEPTNPPGSLIRGSTINDNRAGRDGGGISNAGILVIADSTVRGNRAGGQGGGISNTADLTMDGVTFEDNTPGDCSGC